ncbi:MAG: YfcE family phosphodiesterase [Christensenellales bacterium]
MGEAITLAVVADSHGSAWAVRRAAARVPVPDYFIHLGDHGQELFEAGVKAKRELIALRGNCDAMSFSVLEQYVGQIGGLKVLAAHGHRYRVKQDLLSLSLWGRAEGADLVLYAHSHRRDITPDGKRILLNPGSCAVPRDGRPPSMAYIEILDGKIHPVILDV